MPHVRRSSTVFTGISFMTNRDAGGHQCVKFERSLSWRHEANVLDVAEMFLGSVGQRSAMVRSRPRAARSTDAVPDSGLKSRDSRLTAVASHRVPRCGPDGRGFRAWLAPRCAARAE